MIFKHFSKPIKVSQTESVAQSDLPGWWMEKYFGSVTCSQDICKSDADPDQDKLTNTQELYYHTNPLVAFTVNDSLNDGQLVAAGFDPSRAGRMTFDQVAEPDNILGESLLVNQDLKDIVAEQNDISKVPLPLVADDKLKVTSVVTEEVYQRYSSTLKDTINKYFTSNDLANITETLKSNPADTESIKTKSGLLANELKAITVPQRMLMYHKYLLAFFELLPKVLLNDNDIAQDTSSTASDVWYQNAQAFFVTTQKLNIEAQSLSTINQTRP